MFWRSVVEGLKLLGYWQVWLVVVLHMIVTFGVLFIMALAAGDDPDAVGRVGAGCLARTLLGWPLQASVLAFGIAYLMPILFGGESGAPFSYILATKWAIVKAALFAMVAVFLLSFVPVVGGILAESPGITVFLHGLFIFRILAGPKIDEVLSIPASLPASVYPGFWITLALLAIASLVVMGSAFGLSALVEMFTRDRPDRASVRELSVVTVGGALSILAGIVPLFVYASYVRLSLWELM